jgi:hypothetical protein
MDPKDIKLMMAQLEVMTATLQAALGAPKAKKTKKVAVEGEVKKSNPWLDFTKRVRLVLIENGQKPGLVTQFCKALKEAKPYDDWSDDAILEQRKSWVEPAKKISEKAEKAEKPESQSRPTDMPVGEWVATKHAEIAEKTAVAEAKASGKPEQIAEKMAEGKLRKFFEEVVLLKQAFVMNPDQTIEALIADTAKELGSPVVMKSFVRFALGEGVEKKQDDFAAEVAAQVAAAKQSA